VGPGLDRRENGFVVSYTMSIRSLSSILVMPQFL
jgi:hypothetical protein